MPRTAPPFWDRVERGQGCWEWTAARDRHGAGVVWWDGKTRRAAAVAFFLTHGRWAEHRITGVIRGRRDEACSHPPGA